MTQRALISRLVGLYLRQFEDRHLNLSVEDYARVKSILSYNIEKIPSQAKGNLSKETIEGIGNMLVAITAKDEQQQSLHNDYFNAAKDQLVIKKSPLSVNWILPAILTLGVLAFIIYSIYNKSEIVNSVFQIVQVERLSKIELDSKKIRTVPINLEYVQFQDSLFIINDKQLNPGDTFPMDIGNWVLIEDEVNMLNFIPNPKGIIYDSTFSIFCEIKSSVLHYPNSLPDSIEVINKGYGNYGDTLCTKFQFNYKVRIPFTIKGPKIEKDSLVYPVINFQAYPYQDHSITSLEQKIENAYVPVRRWFYKWRYPLSLLVWLSVLAFMFLKWKNSKKVVKKDDAQIDGPFFYHLRIPDRPKVRINTETSQNLDHLRKVDHKGRPKLNLDKTIDSLIHSGGFLEDFIYEKSGMKVHYLFLIHMRSRTDHRAQFWNEMVEVLSKKDIACDKYYYDDRTEIFFNSSSDNTLSIKQLKNDFPESVVVLIGNNHQLIDEEGEISSFANFFNQWDSKFILSHKNYYAWSYNEKVLKEVFHLLPAQLVSLKFLDYIPNDDDKVKFKTQFDDHIIVYEEIIDHKKIKVNYNAVQQEWIAACALYPDLHYDISLELGRAVYAERGAEFDCREVEKVFSMPWFAKGYFPPELRKELINSLDESLKIKLRQKIASQLGILEPPQGSYAHYRYRSGQLTNAFYTSIDKTKKADIRSQLKEFQDLGIPYDLPNDDAENHDFQESKDSIIYEESNKFLNPNRLIKSLLIAFSFFFLLYAFSIEPRIITTFNVSHLGSTLDHKIWADSAKLDSFVTHNNLIPFKIVTESKLKGNDTINTIWHEYLNRENIRIKKLTIQDLPKIEQTFQQYKPSLLNLGVDFLNQLILEGEPFKGLRTLDIAKNDTLYKNGILFCGQINQLDQFVTNNRDSSLNFSYIDSLRLINDWCFKLDSTSIENIENIDKASVLFGTQNITQQERNRYKDILRSFDIDIIDTVLNSNLNVYDRMVYYRDIADQKKAVQLRQRLGNNFDISRDESLSNNLYVHISDTIQIAPPDVCDNVNCLNGGKCVNGQCDCPVYYSGNDCSLGPITVGMHHYRADSEDVYNVSQALKNSGFELLYNQEHETKGDFLSDQYTLFYYDDRLESHAKSIAAELSKITSKSIEVLKGAGEIVRKETLPFTYRLHLIQSDNTLCESLILPLVRNLSKSSAIYDQYSESKKTFKYAKQLYTINTQMLKFLDDNRNVFPNQFTNERKQLEEHFRAWTKGYEGQNNGKKIFYDGDIFDLKYPGPTFPKAAAANLETFYMKECRAIDSIQFKEFPKILIDDEINGIGQGTITEELTKINITDERGYPIKRESISITNSEGKSITTIDSKSLAPEIDRPIDITAKGYFPQKVDIRSQISNTQLNIELKAISQEQKLKYSAFQLGYLLFRSVNHQENMEQEIIRLKNKLGLEGTFNELNFRNQFKEQGGELLSMKILIPYYEWLQAFENRQILNAFKLGLEGSFCTYNYNKSKNPSKEIIVDGVDITIQCDESLWLENSRFNYNLIGLPNNFEKIYNEETLYTYLNRIN